LVWFQREDGYSQLCFAKNQDEEGIHQSEPNTFGLVADYTQVCTHTHLYSHLEDILPNLSSFHRSDTKGKKYFFNQSFTADMTESILCFYEGDKQDLNWELGAMNMLAMCVQKMRARLESTEQSSQDKTLSIMSECHLISNFW